jgi:hypothetical protein
MPDQLTSHERAAIAAYTGPVQRIPRGASSEITYQWKGGDHGFTASRGNSPRDRLAANYRIRDRGIRMAALRQREINGASPKPPSGRVMITEDALQARRAEVRRLTMEGLLQVEIAERLGFQACVITYDIRVMRRAGGFPSVEECRAIRRRRGLA